MTADKIIIYDDNCPLCCWYTDAFVKTGLLAEGGRYSFTNLDADALGNQVSRQQSALGFAKTLQSGYTEQSGFGEIPNHFKFGINIERSKDEIPLVDVNGGETLYGIDSLVHILGTRWEWVAKIANWAPVNWFLKKLYKLISYNRRVIVASETPAGAFDCAPKFDFFYRYFYLGIALLVGTGGLLAFGVKYFELTYLPVLPITVLGIFLAMHSFKTKENLINYLGIMLTPFLAGGLLLWAAVGIPLLALPLGLLALVLSIRMWWRRYPIAPGKAS